MTSITLGIGELITLALAFCGFLFAVIRMFFARHEHSMNDKLEPIKVVLHDVKKLELEQIRMDGKMAITYATKEELLRSGERHDKVVERIFALLQVMNDKLDKKVDRDDCTICTNRKELRQ